MQTENNNSQSLFEYLFCGVIITKSDETFSPIEINNEFLDIVGNTRKEFFETCKSIFDLIDSSYKKEAINNITEQLEQNHTAIYETKISKKDKTDLFVLFRIKRGFFEETPVYYFIVIDITKRKLMEEQLRLSEARFQIVTEQSESIVLEYNYQDNTMFYSQNFSRILDRPVDLEDPSTYFFDPQFYHPDDIQTINNLFSSIYEGENHSEGEIRVKKGADSYIWCFMQVTTIFDADISPIKTIGTITDIDEQKRNEEMLKAKSEKDTLTLLYNKIYTEKMVDKIISDSGPNSIHGLLSIDVDNFKSVNDTFGHLYGDEIIKRVANKIYTLFRASDIIGRFGGDEFVAFIINLPTAEFLQKKAQELCESVLEKLPIENTNGQYVQISSSIGIALFNEHGNSFSELYANADTALYAAKRKGKNRYCFYADDLES